jgi:hypothetical protein
MFNKILYCGAGTHLEPIIYFKNISNFVLIDGQPRSEYGLNYYDKTWYKKTFLLQLSKKMKELKLKLISTKVITNNFSEINVPNLESECLTITDDNNKNVKYYTSTSLPFDLFDNTQLQLDMETCDTLFISGYCPPKKIIKYIKKPFNLIGCSYTWFPLNIENLLKEQSNSSDDYELYLWIINNNSMIKTYTVIDEKNNTKYSCENYQDFCEKLKKIL